MRCYEKMKCSFSMVELLVVIAVILILASMLLPALGKAREKAKSMDCINRLKQIGSGVQFYIDDNGGWITPMGVGVSTGTKDWTCLIQEYLGRRINGVGSPPGKQDQFFYCPVNTTIQWPAIVQSPFLTNYCSNDTVMGYRYSPANLLDRADCPGRKIDMIKQPSRTFLMADGNGLSSQKLKVYALSQINGAAGIECLIFPAHMPQFNTLFVDGHCKGLTLNDIPESFAYDNSVSNYILYR